MRWKCKHLLSMKPIVALQSLSKKVSGINMVDILLEEHKMIDEMIDLLELSVKRAKGESGLPQNTMSEELDFCKNFVNKTHEVKEEELLAPEMHRHGFPLDRGPILEMFEDHRKGRAILRRLTATEKIVRADERQQSFAQLAAAYSLYLYEHLREEEENLFKAAKLAIDAGRQQELAEQSLKLDENVLGKNAHEKYLKIIREVKRALE